MKRIYILIGVGVFALILVLIKNYPRDIQTIYIDQVEIAQNLADILPFDHAHALTLRLNFTNLTVELNEETQRIDVHCDLSYDVRLDGKDPKPAKATAHASLGYDDQAREFVLADVIYTACEHGEKRFKEPGKRIPLAAQSAVIKFLEGAMIYQVTSRDVQKQRAIFDLTDWTIESGRMKAQLTKIAPIVSDFLKEDDDIDVDE